MAKVQELRLSYISQWGGNEYNFGLVDRAGQCCSIMYTLTDNEQWLLLGALDQLAKDTAGAYMHGISHWLFIYRNRQIAEKQEAKENYDGR